MARAFGFGRRPGIDLPGEQTRAGSWTGRSRRTAGTRPRTTTAGTPSAATRRCEDRPARAAFLTRLAAENCSDGWRFQVGDAANLSIGQGESPVSPLQLARGVRGAGQRRHAVGAAAGPGGGRPGRQGGPEIKRPSPRQAAGRPQGAGLHQAAAFARGQRRVPRPARSPGSRWTRCWSAARPARPRCSASRTPPGSPPGRRRQPARTSWSRCRAGRAGRAGRGPGRPGDLRGHLRAGPAGQAERRGRPHQTSRRPRPTLPRGNRHELPRAGRGVAAP